MLFKNILAYLKKIRIIIFLHFIYGVEDLIQIMNIEIILCLFISQNLKRLFFPKTKVKILLLIPIMW